MLVDNKELERCSKRDFIPKTDEEMFYNVYKYAVKKVVEYNNLCVEKYKCYKYDELESAAFYGVAKAIKTFKADKNVKFLTYASRCIVNEMNIFLRNENRFIYNTISMETAVSTSKDNHSVNIENMIEDTSKDFFSEEDEINLNKLLYYTFTNLKTKEKLVVVNRLYGVMYDDMLSTIGVTRACSSKIMVKIRSKLKDKKESFFYNTKNTTFFPYVEFDRMNFKVSIETNELIKEKINQEYLTKIKDGYVIYQMPFEESKVYPLLLDIIRILK